MRSFAVAALISAAAANVITQYSTTTDSIISCGPEVTNCPGSSTAYHPVESSTTCTTTTDEAHPTSPAVYTTTSSAPVYTTSAPVYTTSTADAHPTYSTSTCTDEEAHPTTLETYTKPSKPTYYSTITGAVGGKPSASASSGGEFPKTQSLRTKPIY
jgi:hypothetical protein